MSVRIESVRRTLQDKRTPPIASRLTGTLKVGKMIARESGLFNKGRRGRTLILEELGTNQFAMLA